MRPEIATLREAVEAASGPSRELDARIEAALNIRPGWAVTAREALVPHPDGRVTLGRGGAGWAAPEFTRSIDAALALVERVLPGWSWGVFVRGGLVQADVCKPSPLRPMPFVAKGCATPALAILAALVRALETRHEA